jgi:NAD(P)-dependent dehydrogenase (short-subunit alcohol dehydrogenase family)
MSASKKEAGNEHGVITAYPNYAPSKQEQSLPGSEARMDPLAEHLLVEKWDDEGKPYLAEYKGSGKLQGKTAIITGGDSGIGRSVALMYALEGCKLTISHLPEEQEDGDKVVSMVKESKAEGASKEIQSVAGDLMDEAYCKHLVETHIKTYGKLDILVNNASKQIPYKRFEEIDLSNVESTFRSNIMGAMAVTKYALNHLKRGGCIIVSGSVTAFRGSANKVDYSSTKGALHSFTRSLAAQLAPR